jgi:hypothetical protein
VRNAKFNHAPAEFISTAAKLSDASRKNNSRPSFRHWGCIPPSLDACHFVPPPGKAVI